jgi:hypothetical protein
MKRCRLIYKSQAAGDFPSNTMLRDIEETARQNNSTHDITGLLLVSGNRFLQVLEGPYTEVNALFSRIVHDKRHRQVELVTFEALETPYFDNWNMRLVDLYDLPKGPRELMAQKYPHDEGSILIPEHIHEIYALLLDAKAICQSTSRPPGDEVVPAA